MCGRPPTAAQAYCPSEAARHRPPRLGTAPSPGGPSGALSPPPTPGPVTPGWSPRHTEPTPAAADGKTPPAPCSPVRTAERTAPDRRTGYPTAGGTPGPERAPPWLPVGRPAPPAAGTGPPAPKSGIVPSSNPLRCVLRSAAAVQGALSPSAAAAPPGPAVPRLPCARAVHSPGDAWSRPAPGSIGSPLCPISAHSSPAGPALPQTRWSDRSSGSGTNPHTGSPRPLYPAQQSPGPVPVFPKYRS